MANTPAPFPNFASKVTIKAVKSGNASDPTVWSANHALMPGDFFQVPAGISVTWDLTACPNLAGGIVQGTLDCGSAPGAKVMNAVTVFIDAGGSFLCGSCVNNVALQGTFALTFLDVAPDPTFDPGQFGTGFVTMGAKVDLCGAATKTAFVRCKGAAQGATSLQLLETPAGWNNGDELLIPGTEYNYAAPEDEVLLQGSLTGNTLTLAKPLAFDHSVPVVSFNAQSWTSGTIVVTITYTLTANSDLSVTINSTYTWKDSASGQGGTFTNSFTWKDAYLVSPTQVSPCLYVGNLTRNIVFQSANPTGTRGHVMFMKDMMGNPSVVNACHVRVNGMGRTDATKPVTDPLVDANGVLVPGTADNPRAHYAWHSHRQGQAASALQTWDSIVVSDYKKWAFDNHDSNVAATNLIAYNGQGAAFATERGTEIGWYRGCFGVRSTGVGDGKAHVDIDNDPVNNSRTSIDDMGFIGNGVWLQGPGVEVSDCVLSGHVSGGVYFFSGGAQSNPPYGVISNTFGFQNLPASLQTFFSGPIGGGLGFYSATNPPPILAVPAVGIRDNVVFASGAPGFINWGDTEAPSFVPGAPSTMSGCTTWNNPGGTLQSYTHYNGYADSVFIGPHVQGAKLSGQNSYTACDTNPAYSFGQFFTNPAVIGWDAGIVLPHNPDVITDGYFANVQDFYCNVGLLGATEVNPELGKPNYYLWQGQPVFAALQQPLASGQERYNFYLDAPKLLDNPFYDVTKGFDLNALWKPDYYMLPGNQQIYLLEQQAGYVPFPAGGTYFGGFPPELIGLTQAQIQAKYGMGLLGSTVTAAAVTPWTSNAIIGPAQNYPTPVYNRPYYGFTNFLNAVYPASPSNYVLDVYDFVNDGNQQHRVTYPALNLQAGWNLLAQSPGGVPSVFAVWSTSGATSAPAITTQPMNQSVMAGAMATFTASASGSPAPTVQWQVSSNGGQSWSAVQGATSATLTLSNVTIALNGAQYRAVFTNSAGSATSNAATLTVQPAQVTTAASMTATALRPYTLSFAITASNGVMVNEGTVSYTVFAGQVQVTSGTVNVQNGKAVVTVNLPVGSCVASYSYADPQGTLPGTSGSTTIAVN